MGGLLKAIKVCHWVSEERLIDLTAQTHIHFFMQNAMVHARRSMDLHI
jgi:hypothetical protein